MSIMKTAPIRDPTPRSLRLSFPISHIFASSFANSNYFIRLTILNYDWQIEFHGYYVSMCYGLTPSAYEGCNSYPVNLHCVDGKFDFTIVQNS